MQKQQADVQLTQYVHKSSNIHEGIEEDKSTLNDFL